jgi:hypothetical protein
MHISYNGEGIENDIKVFYPHIPISELYKQTVDGDPTNTIIENPVYVSVENAAIGLKGNITSEFALDLRLYDLELELEAFKKKYEGSSKTGKKKKNRSKGSK